MSSYNKIARRIGIFDKIAIFVCTGDFFMQVKAFKIGVPLNMDIREMDYVHIKY